MLSKTLRKICQYTAFSDPFFPEYGKNHIGIFTYLDRIRHSVQIQENADTILLTYGKILIRENPCFGILDAVAEQELHVTC